MQLVILHYHLNTGGVTRVVQNHLLALASAAGEGTPERVLLVHGGRAENWPEEEVQEQAPFPIEHLAVEGLDYDRDEATATDQLAQSLETELRNAGAQPETTLLHWHNHSLGKNVSAPLAIRRLAERGYRTLLQVHDFAEDFRPQNYRQLAHALDADSPRSLSAQLYPQADHIFYAVLNGRDYQVLHRAGIVENRLSILSNPTSAPPSLPDAREARQLVESELSLATDARLAVYPVRGIRRKNLGEMLLWSALSDKTSFLVTLAPQNPVERVSFDRWQSLAKELQLPCRLGRDASSSLDYEHLLAASDLLVTTSVAEGFGMTFLESWLAGRRLLGRNLPEITADFRQVGLRLDQLYVSLEVPTEWIDRREYCDRMSYLVRETYQAFGIALPAAGALEDQLTEILEQSTVDFASLPTRVQVAVIQRVQGSEQDREQLLALNPKLDLSQSAVEHLIETNSSIVEEHFSFSAIGRNLNNLYGRVMQARIGTTIAPPTNGESVLESFLKIDRLHPVRVEP